MYVLACKYWYEPAEIKKKESGVGASVATFVRWQEICVVSLLLPPSVRERERERERERAAAFVAGGLVRRVSPRPAPTKMHWECFLGCGKMHLHKSTRARHERLVMPEDGENNWIVSFVHTFVMRIVLGPAFSSKLA
jgi:hypothetical protein